MCLGRLCDAGHFGVIVSSLRRSFQLLYFCCSRTQDEKIILLTT